MSSVVDIPLSKLDHSPGNARKVYTNIPALAETIAESGLLENLVVRKMPTGRYEVDAGNRRLKAMRLLVEKDIWHEDKPVACKVITTSGSVESLLENIQRDDDSYWDMGDRFIRMIEEEKYTQRMIAEKVGKTQTWVSICITIARGLAPKVRKHLEQMGPSRPNVSEIKKIALLLDKDSLKPDEPKQMKLLERIVSRPKRAPSGLAGKARSDLVGKKIAQLEEGEYPAYADAIIRSVLRYLKGEDSEFKLRRA